jgi:homoserine kinase
VVRVPASSANLGPGYDVLAAALAIDLELEVEEGGEFAVECDVPGVPLDRTNLCVRAFELLHPADGVRRPRRGAKSGARRRSGQRRQELALIKIPG